jgi:CDGSH-type Zn-finger protein/uncharacterized Fe-S cluster protein YjdI
VSDESAKSPFPGREVDVDWDGRLCIHVGECGRAKGDLFVGGRQPWCQPDLVSADDVIEVVERCPTGAITHRRKDGGAEESAASANTVVVANNGPLYARGELRIEGAADDMPGVRFRAALCRCGQSKRKPFCDGSHDDAGFRDQGAIGDTGDGIDAPGGALEIKPFPNGPLLLSGNVTLATASGREAWRGKGAALCRCGESKNKPFCDGTHKQVGFQAP